MSIEGFYAWTDNLKAIQYGPGCLEIALPKFLDLLEARKALIVTGRSLFEKTDVIKRVESILKARDAHAGVFYKIGEHVPYADLQAGIKAFKESGADIIVAVGGGSPIDASKAILHNLQTQEGGPTRKQIAIPTTLSAAEYTPHAGFTNEQGMKTTVSTLDLMPAAIILDAELTLATPERLWLSSGMRALDHAVEGLYRPRAPQPLKSLGYATIADLFKYLPISKANPQDVDVRQRLQVAAWTSMWPTKFEKRTPFGLSHALGHKLGASYRIPHGITTCLTLAAVVNLMAEIGSEDDKEWLSGALFHLRQQTSGSPEADVRALSASIQDLVNRLGLRSTLAEYKVPREDLPKIAQLALGETGGDLQSEVTKVLESIYD